jgi:potassium efflux system protein
MVQKMTETKRKTGKASFCRGYRRKKTVLWIFFGFFLLFLGEKPALCVPAQATGGDQTLTDSAETLPELTVQALEERIRIAKEAPKLPPESKQRIITFYQKAIVSLQRREKALSDMDQYAHALEELPKPTDLPKGVMKPVRAAAVEERAKAMALGEIEGEIARLHIQLAEAQTQLEIKQKKLQDVIKQPGKLRKSIAQYEQMLAQLQEALARPKPEDDSPRLIRARRTSLRAQQTALQAQLKAADQEVTLAKRELAITQNQQALVSRKVNRLEAQIKTWESVREKRQSDVGFIELRQAQESLNAMATNDWPEAGDFLRKLGEENLALSKTLVDLDSKENQSAKTTQLLETRAAQTERDFELTQRRITMMGLTRKAGQWLQSRRETLRKSRANTKVALQRRNEILRVNLANDELIQQRQDYLVLKNSIYEQLEKLESSLTPKENEKLNMQAFLLLESRRKLLEETGASYGKYLKQLNGQEAAQKKIDLLSEKYRDFINQRLLWTQSADLISYADAKRSESVLLWMVAPENWSKFMGDLGLSMGSTPAVWGLLLLGILALLLSRSWVKRRILAHAEKATTDGMGGTLTLICLTLIRSVGIPFVLYLGAIHLWTFPIVNYFTRSVCAGVAVTLEAYIFLRIVIQFCRPKGIGQTHFAWGEPVCRLLARCAKILLVLFLPILFFVVMIQYGPQAQGFRSSLGRILFLLSMIPLFLVFWQCLKKSSPLVQTLRNGRVNGWVAKYLPFWSGLVLICPVILFILPVVGYYFTAYELGSGLAETGWLVLLLILADALMRRGLRLAQVKLALKKAELAREEAARKKLESENEPEESIQTNPVSAPPELEIEEISEETSLLIRTVILIAGLVGLWLIWEEIFPAFRFFDNILLWSREVGVDKAGTPILESVTLLNFIMALIIFAGTFIAVRTGTALLEILMAKSSKLDAGSQQSFGLIGRYAIFMVGLFAGLNALGIGWKQFQWLAAAMTVGLSFGLKDIFANFVSGIIILFERPIRLGDTVTVAGSSGKVSKIRIRSTTITDWDRRELIVPNQAFLSEKITNWSLSDRFTRVVINVGIGYGSDAKKAEALLLKIAQDCEVVKNSPAPSVFFTGFGADSLDFALRVHVALSDRVKVQNLIRHRINQIFQEEGIEIPYAQRDAHLDTSSGPLDIRLLSEKEPSP